MQNRIYTILIVSEGRKAPFGFQLSLRVFSALCLLFCIAVSGVLFLARSHAQLAEQVTILPLLEEENALQEADLHYLESEIRQLLNQMAELEALGRKVQDIMAGGEDENQRTPLLSRSGQRGDFTLEQSLAYLKETLPQKTEEMNQLVSEVEEYRSRLAATPDFWPVRGTVTSPFGWRRDPVSLGNSFHRGVDIGSPAGATVRAAADGVVKRASYWPGWGNLIVIDHGVYQTYYAHLQRFHIKTGQKVSKGEKIGEVGSTGFSTGPHLHFEIHKHGKPLDPLTILR